MKKKRKYSQGARSVGEAMVQSVDGSACVRLLDVTLLDRGVWAVVTSLLKERERERAIRENTCAFSTGKWRGDATGHQNQLAVPKPPIHTLTLTHMYAHPLTHRKTKDTHATTHTLSMKNDIVKHMVTF